ncbi:MAG: helix-turn-helix domain-containing protein [Candidatus Jettenia sp. CY-1]|nr:MAG: helix-turn-helix domain-containing protein [Candidatus Jettenia sp. CY-1]
MEIVKNDNGLMDMNQAAAYLNIKVSTLYGMTMKRKIPYIKVGKLNRFRRLDLDIWIDKNAQG